MGYVLGLGGPYYHDASACLVDHDGAIVAFVEEERLTRRKHNKNSRSCSQSAAYCLASAGVALRDVEEIAIAWNPEWPVFADHCTDAELIRELLDPGFFSGYTPPRLTIIEHHLAHAASAFYPSGFPESAVMVVDGAGDGAATSLYRGGPDGLKLLRQYSFTQSLGWFYENVAEHIGLGDWTSSGKLMGLAGYGRPTYDFDFLRAGGDDGYALDLTPFGLSPTPDAITGYDHYGYYRQLKRALGRAFGELGAPAHRVARRYDPATGQMPVVTEFTPEHANFAASAQAKLEQCLLALAQTAMAQAGSSRLCVAGGVGLNCSANGALSRNSGATDMFFQPVASDAGCAIGAALECVRRAGRLRIPGAPMTTTAWGPVFSDAQIAATLKSLQIRHTYHGDAISGRVAGALARGGVVGWFQGPAEGGPRALGRRSILADPRTVASRDRINRDIKRREMWRPLAPSILGEAAPRFMTQSGMADFMIVAQLATGEASETIPATVHIDGTLRPQTVHADADPRYAGLIGAFGAETGIPVLLNTSFNHEAEPIVCNPTDALRTFFSTPIDALALGGFLILKDDASQ